MGLATILIFGEYQRRQTLISPASPGHRAALSRAVFVFLGFISPLGANRPTYGFRSFAIRVNGLPHPPALKGSCLSTRDAGHGVRLCPGLN
jgi:hypothetical protein